LVAAAATVGIVFAKWALGVLVAMFAGVRGRIVLEPHFDSRIVGFTVAVALVTALLFSVAPALHATRTDAARTGSPGRVSTGRFQLRLGNALVAMQIMLDGTVRRAVRSNTPESDEAGRRIPTGRC
jgi:hypothetical protein